MSATSREIMDLAAMSLGDSTTALNLAALLKMQLTIGTATCFATAMVPNCADGLVIGCAQMAAGEDDAAMVRRCIAECATAYARRQP